MKRGFPMLAFCLVGFFVDAIADPSVAAPVKVACFTKRVLVRTEGAPPVILVTFDERAKSAELFAQAYGGIVTGHDAIIESDLVTFTFKTGAGEAGNAVIHRGTGAAVFTIGSEPRTEVVADCRPEPTRAF